MHIQNICLGSNSLCRLYNESYSLARYLKKREAVDINIANATFGKVAKLAYVGKPLLSMEFNYILNPVTHNKHPSKSIQSNLNPDADLGIYGGYVFLRLPGPPN